MTKEKIKDQESVEPLAQSELSTPMALEEATRVVTRYFIEGLPPNLQDKYVQEFLCILEGLKDTDKIERTKVIVIEEAQKHYHLPVERTD